MSKKKEGNDIFYSLLLKYVERRVERREYVMRNMYNQNHKV